MTDLTIGVGSAPRLTKDLAVVAAAPVVALVVWLAWTQVGGVDLSAGANGDTRSVSAAAVVTSTALLSLLGWGLLRVLEARTRRGVRTWTWVSVGVLLLSFLGPLGATTTEAGLGLASLHVVVALVLVAGLRGVRDHGGQAAGAVA